jgi:hypothetical protein
MVGGEEKVGWQKRKGVFFFSSFLFFLFFFFFLKAVIWKAEQIIAAFYKFLVGETMNSEN